MLVGETGRAVEWQASIDKPLWRNVPYNMPGVLVRHMVCAVGMKQLVCEQPALGQWCIEMCRCSRGGGVHKDLHLSGRGYNSQLLNVHNNLGS